MQQKALIAGFVIFLIMVSSQSVLANNVADGGKAYAQDQDDKVSQWVQDNYAFVARSILPDSLRLVPFPMNVKWIVVVSIKRPFSLSEYWMSMTRNYDGSVKAMIKVPHEHSIAAQMKELKKQNPEATTDSIIKMLRVDSYEFSDADFADLRNIANGFEQITFSPIMPDLLGSDLFEYHFWTESQFGQQMSAQLAGFGPDGKQQPHVLVGWAERLRLAAEIHLKHRGPEAAQH